MILALLALFVLGNDNIDTLSAIPMFEVDQIAEAKELHDSLSALYARVTVDPGKVNSAKKALARAYTHYKIFADEVKEHGRFVFEGTDRYDAYISRYHRLLGKSARHTETVPEAPISEQFSTNPAKRPVDRHFGRPCHVNPYSRN